MPRYDADGQVVAGTASRDDLDLRRRVAVVRRSICLAQQTKLLGVEPFGYLPCVGLATGGTGNLAGHCVVSDSRSAARNCNESSRRRCTRSHSLAGAGSSLISVRGLDGSSGRADDVEDEVGMGQHGNVAAVDLVGGGTHSLGRGPL
jgi:hypothetical protein